MDSSLVAPKALRAKCREGSFVNQTSGYCKGNPKPCPLIECLSDGEYALGDIDIRTDLPKYRIYENGILVKELTDISSYWRDDFVTFIIGCSFSFEDAMLRAGLPVRHLEPKPCSNSIVGLGVTTETGIKEKTVPMYNTNIPCRSAGRFAGNMVVSMRPMMPLQAVHATEVTSRYPRVHGAPLHIGNPSEIGIADVSQPDYGDPVEVRPGEMPVFWACGVTPMAVVMQSKPAICITHAPGHMLVLDLLNDQLSMS